MSKDENAQEVNAEAQKPSSVVSPTPSKDEHLLEQKREANAEAKAYRLEKEALQRQLDTIKQTHDEAELEATEKLKLRDLELTDLKASIEKDKLAVQYVDAVKAKGFSEKIARLGVPKDLSADNLLDSVKKFDKDFTELKDPKDDPKKAPSPFPSVQPGTQTDGQQPPMSLGDIAEQVAQGK